MRASWCKETAKFCKAGRRGVTASPGDGNIGSGGSAVPIDLPVQPNVLLVDDDRELTGMLAEYLAHEGFRTRQAHDVAAALDPDTVGCADVIVLDVMLPGGSGLDVLRILRARGSRLPILMLTARGDDVDRIVGLELGADDYLPKPFNPRELVARLRAVLRRIAAAPSPERDRLHAGGLTLDFPQHRVELDGRVVELTGAEFRVLAEFMRAPGRVLGREELTQRALGRRLEVHDRSIDTHVSNLRRKLGLDMERGIAILVTGLVSWLLARSVTRPVGRVTAAVRDIASGRLDGRVAAGIGARRDEIGVLAREFDAMAERLRALLAGRERLLRDVSHELRSPLARLQVALGLARQPGADVSVQLGRIEREAGRLEALIAQVLRLSRLDAATEHARRDVVDLVALVRDVARDAQFESESGGIEVEVDAVNEPLPVSGDPDLPQSAVENVVRNAVRYTDARRGVAINCGSGGGRARVVVRDYGHGVPESELERIFEPFHRVADDRTRASGGNGIGLAITARVLRSHDGSVRARNAVGGGLEVVLELPLGGRDTT